MCLRHRKRPLISLLLVLALLTSPLARAFCAVVKAGGSPAAAGVTSTVITSAAIDVPCHGSAAAVHQGGTHDHPATLHLTSSLDETKHHGASGPAGDGDTPASHHDTTAGAGCAVCLALAAVTSAQALPPPPPRDAHRPAPVLAPTAGGAASAQLHLGGIGSRAPPARV